MSFLIRIVVNAIALWATAYLLPGMTVSGSIVNLLILGAVFGVVNALVKPIITALSCPLVILTLGLFILVINGGMLLLTASLVGPEMMQIRDWTVAIIAGIVMGIINMILETIVGLSEG
ncbi:MAG: phage holin family protein [Anaerolineae bacterium]|nr:phage holin family protein [Anaerolineae bacterium]